MNFHITKIFFFISFFSFSLSNAQEVGLSEISISGNLTPTNKKDLGSTVTILNQDDINNSPYPYFVDFIQNVPSVTIAQNGPKGSSSSVFVRGLGSEYVKVLIDGIDYGDVSSIPVTPNLSGIALSNLEKIEVLKGSQSALYGSSAIGGVISIITDDFSENGNVNLEFGSFSTFGVDLKKNFSGENTDTSFYISEFTTDGFSAKYQGEEPDGYKSRTFSFANKYYFSDTNTFFINFRSQKEDGDQDGFQNDPPYGFVDKEDEIFSINTLALRSGIEIDQKNIIRIFDIDFFNTKRFYTGPYEYDGKRIGSSYSVRNSSFSNPFVYGVEMHKDEADVEGIKKDINQNHVFGEYIFQNNDNIDLALSARGSNHSKFGNNATGRLSLSYKFSGNLIGRGSLGTGYRSPSLYELFSPFSGNENLLPEKSLTSDLGLNLSLLDEKINIDTSFFNTEITDEIVYDMTTFGYAQNDQKQNRQGLEFTMNFNPISNYGFSLSAAHISDAEGNKIRRVPLNEFSLNGKIDISEKLKGGFTLRHVNGLEDDGPLPDFTTLAFKSIYELTEKTNLYLRGENILNEDYQTITDYSTPGRSFYFGISKDL